MKTEYDLLQKQLQELISEETYFLPVLSNASALLFDALPDLNWAGFYLVRDEQLVLGPFQGKIACIHIKKGKGVCGSAWEQDKTLVVEDVHTFPGHIACDCASESEIVIPLHKDGKIFGVLDIDSPVKGRFDTEDAAGLEGFAKILEQGMDPGGIL
ncbi:MAG: GAF domain-containing protein [Lachnospiraceae bacterium]|nr:GAF domain-containing protein [Lachnospiraceae bacterium]